MIFARAQDPHHHGWCVALLLLLLLIFLGTDPLSLIVGIGIGEHLLMGFYGMHFFFVTPSHPKRPHARLYPSLGWLP